MRRAKSVSLGPVHSTTPEEFENGGFTHATKTHQMFSVHPVPEEFQKRKRWSGKSHDYHDAPRFLSTGK